MRQHASVTWVETNRPWELELRLLSSGLGLPLNLHGNPLDRGRDLFERSEAEGTPAC
jgi:hypothetical protein